MRLRRQIETSPGGAADPPDELDQTLLPAVSPYQIQVDTLPVMCRMAENALKPARRALMQGMNDVQSVIETEAFALGSQTNST